MLLQIQTLCYWHWCLEILVVSLKSWLGGQPMGDGQVHHIQTVFLTHSSWDKEAAGGWCQKLCADYSPRSAPAGHPISLQEQKHPVQVVGSRPPPGHETVSKSSRLCCGPLLAGAPFPLPFLRPAPTGHISQGTVRKNPRPCCGPHLTGAAPPHWRPPPSPLPATSAEMPRR